MWVCETDSSLRSSLPAIELQLFRLEIERHGSLDHVPISLFTWNSNYR